MQTTNLITSFDLYQVFMLHSSKDAEQRKILDTIPLARVIINLYAVIKQTLSTNSIVESYTYLKKDIENYILFAIQNPPPMSFFQQAAVEFLQTKPTKDQIDLYHYIELLQEIDEAQIETVGEKYRGKIVPLETIETLFHLHPNESNLGYIATHQEALLSFIFGLQVASFYNLGKLKLNKTTKKELLHFLDKSIVSYGACAILLGFWQITNDDSRPLLKEIENLVLKIKTEQQETLSYLPVMLTVFDKTYYLSSPLPCIVEKEENYYIVRNEKLDIIGTGLTLQAAKESFTLEFDHIYTRYNELPANKLSARLRKIKETINLLVKTVL